ncbi:hypothetical protein [Salipiger sp. PrR002]|uniref:hypothetical protein n=1 Tax=Salipiger sp. PrR002 TaxID=2706489 RepID=UPI0013BDE331|nr:hypothetical protein [Salipiger sp. PrR002]NDW00048.1 hypothetical protein [Salipiger sp. PrR002]NDW56944.1 hypothetical protein [Salipiger sp. PrR004]
MSHEPNLFSEIFNERGALLALFGALGGTVRSAALKTTWREGLRVTFIGSCTSFGVGALAPTLLKPWIGELPEEMSGALGTLCAAAFLVGLVSVTIIERFIEEQKSERDSE